MTSMVVANSVSVWSGADTRQPQINPSTPVHQIRQLINSPWTGEVLWPADAPFWRNVRQAHLDEMSKVLIETKPYPSERFYGKGIVIAGGGKYFASAYVTIRILRKVGCILPIELWHLDDREIKDWQRKLLLKQGVFCVNAGEMTKVHPTRIMGGWQLKSYAVMHSRFSEVLFLDADSYPTVDPSYLFSDKLYSEHGSLFWPDGEGDFFKIVANEKWEAFGVEAIHDRRIFESGQFMVDKSKCWAALTLAVWLNAHSDYSYKYVYGDKDTFLMAWLRTKTSFGMPPGHWKQSKHTLLQSDPEGRFTLFQHRHGDKFSTVPVKKDKVEFETSTQRHSYQKFHRQLAHEEYAFKVLAELRRVEAEQKARKRFAVLSFYTPDLQSMYDVVAPNHQAYCDRHGYDYYCDAMPSDRGFHELTFYKMSAILRRLEQYDWVFWCDLDSVFLDPTIPIDGFVDPEYDLVVNHDHNGLNAGHFLIRNSQVSKDFLREVQRLGHFGEFHDQQRMEQLLNDQAFSIKVKVHPQTEFNSYPHQVNASTFILHAAGRKDKVDILRSAVGQAGVIHALED